MDPKDVPKTALRTHELVMPSGLVNTPSTFQHLMNKVFKPFLTRFVLVFCDNVLIYSANMEEHARHLLEVFQLLKQHTLYVKLSKCKFALHTMECLGHQISHEGIATDPAKIKGI